MRMWKAIYSDGSFLDQYGMYGKNGYENIDRTKLVSFAIFDRTWHPDRDFIVPLIGPNGEYAETAWLVPHEKIIYVLNLEPGQKLIYRLLGAKQLLKRTMQEVNQKHFHMIGWQQKIGDKNVQSITYLSEDGVVVQGGKFVGGPPNLIASELDG
jgi:hypothetical protein